MSHRIHGIQSLPADDAAHAYRYKMEAPLPIQCISIDTSEF